MIEIDLQTVGLLERNEAVALSFGGVPLGRFSVHNLRDESTGAIATTHRGRTMHDAQTRTDRVALYGNGESDQSTSSNFDRTDDWTIRATVRTSELALDPSGKATLDVAASGVRIATIPGEGFSLGAMSVHSSDSPG